MTPYLEHGDLQRLQQSGRLHIAPNTTIEGFGLSTLWCPSDGAIVGLRHFFSVSDFGTIDCSQTWDCYSSYAGSMGTWTYWPNEDRCPLRAEARPADERRDLLHRLPPRNLSDQRRPQPRQRPPGAALGRHRRHQQHDSPRRRAHGMLSQNTSVGPDGYVDFYCYNWWFSPNNGDTMFTTFYPINPSKRLKNTDGYLTQGDADAT